MSTQHVPQEENEKHDDSKEDKVNEKDDAWRMVRNNKRDSNEGENGRSTYRVMENDTEDHDECEEDDDRDWLEKPLQLRKIQGQLMDCTTEIEAKLRKKEKMKEKEEEVFFCRKKHVF